MSTMDPAFVTISAATLLKRLEQDNSKMSAQGKKLLAKLQNIGAVRNLEIKAQYEKEDMSSKYHSEGALIQVLGKEQASGCAHCQAQAFNNRFDTCVQLQLQSAENAGPEKRNKVAEACANCRYRNEQSYCTFVTGNVVSEEAIRRLKKQPEQAKALILASDYLPPLKTWLYFIDQYFTGDDPSKLKYYWFANEIIRRAVEFFPSKECLEMVEELCPITETIETYTTLEFNLYDLEKLCNQQQQMCLSMAEKMAPGWKSVMTLYGRATVLDIVMKEVVKERDQTWAVLKCHPLNQFIPAGPKDGFGGRLLKAMTSTFFNRRYTGMISYITGSFSLEPYERTDDDRVGMRDCVLMVKDSGDFGFAEEILVQLQEGLQEDGELEENAIGEMTLGFLNSTIYMKIYKKWAEDSGFCSAQRKSKSKVVA